MGLMYLGIVFFSSLFSLCTSDGVQSLTKHHQEVMFDRVYVTIKSPVTEDVSNESVISNTFIHNI